MIARLDILSASGKSDPAWPGTWQRQALLINPNPTPDLSDAHNQGEYA
jgi:hypothetical protein